MRPDFHHLIDLPGAGPCLRPVDIDRSVTGFSKLVSLRVYSFAEGVVINGEAESDEVFVVLTRGQADIAVSSDGHELGRFRLQHAGGTRAVYLPPHSSYRLSAITNCDIAYARAEPSGTRVPSVLGFTPSADRLDIVGHALGMEVGLAAVMAGEDAAHTGTTPSPERFIHVRSGGEMVATIAGETMGDWDSVALDDGEDDLLIIKSGTAEILTITASRREGAHLRSH